MRTGQAFLAAAAVLAFSFTLGGRATAGSPADFTFNGASIHETVETFSSLPVSCENFPAASDTYQWKLKLAKIQGDFTQDLANNVVLMAFSSGSCKPISGVTNTIEIPPGGVLIHPNGDGTSNVDFSGAVPDFNSSNTSNDINLPFFDNINFHMVYNPTGAPAGGLLPGAGTLDVSGNANLCGVITSELPKQCFILNMASAETADSDTDQACICSTPKIVYFGIDSIL